MGHDLEMGLLRWPPSPDIDAAHALHSLLRRLKVKAVLDCSCGLGQTTFALSGLCYHVEGSDASSIAIELASDLAETRDQHIRCFRYRWDTLGHAAQRKYDCVYNDSFEWAPTRASMRASATGIHSVLKSGGRFVFWGDHQWSNYTRPDVDAEFRSADRFEALPVDEHNGVKLTTLVSRERIPDGIPGNRIHIVEENGATRIEVASAPDIRKWIS